MTHRFIVWLAPSAAVAAVFALAPIRAAGQAPAGAAQTNSPPRTPDGRPDLSGIWQVLNTAAWDIQDHSAQKDVPAGQGVVEGNAIPYQPWAAAKKEENFKNRLTADPDTKCYMPGVPRVTYMPYPFQIHQTPKYVVILYEYRHVMRTIYTDGSPHLPGAPGTIDSIWMGDSRGHWEGDTLVVDVIHFTDQTWFDKAGNFHSTALHLTERYTPVGADHINYEVTIEDPKVFTRPWKMSMPLYRRKEPNVQVLEYLCFPFLQEDTTSSR
jgi:hypothetical protein